MTLKEAHEIGKKQEPVEYLGYVYPRIVSVGYAYDRKGEVYPYIELLDESGISTARVRPNEVKKIAHKKEINATIKGDTVYYE